MHPPRRSYLLLLDIILLIVVMMYITLGTENVPLHGDEATTIWMSKDYETALIDGDFDELVYESPPRRTTEQHMRIITSNLSKVAMGVSWQSLGMTADDLNEQWVWGLDLQWNQENGHVPSEKLLYVTRLSSAWLLALSTIFMLTLSRLLAKQIFTNKWTIILAGWATVGVYTWFYPAILLNGRRAMFEGGLLFGVTLVSWLVVRILAKNHPRWHDYVLLGIGTGVALSTKHSAAFTIILLYSGLVWLDVTTHFRTQQSRQFVISQLMKISLAAGLGLLIFFTLNPLWWSNPFGMPSIVIEQRQLILDEQVTYFPEDKYAASFDRLTGLWEEMINPAPQYYEAAYWIEYDGVEEEIEIYQSSGWAGINNEFLSVMLRSVLFLSGMLFLVYRGFSGSTKQRQTVAFIGLWFGGILIITLFTVPLHWQRYYLPPLVPLTVIMGLGLGVIFQSLCKPRQIYR